MYTGEVIGSVVATVKEEHLEGIPLLVVQVIENGKANQKGDRGGRHPPGGPWGLCLSHRLQGGGPDVPQKAHPADAAIVGFIDSYREEL